MMRLKFYTEPRVLRKHRVIKSVLLGCAMSSAVAMSMDEAAVVQEKDIQAELPIETPISPEQVKANEAIPFYVPRGKGIDPGFVKEVFTEICRLNIREPEIVMRQAMLETGWLRAPFLMKRNNLFGFRYKTYLSFPHWKDSVRYYRDWQGRHLKDSDTNYYAFLTRIRYGVPSYVDHVKKIKWDGSCDQVLVREMPSKSDSLSEPDSPPRLEDRSVPLP